MSAIHWFEIPVSDFERAKTFYEAVIAGSITPVDMREQMGSMLGMLPTKGGVGGTLVHNENPQFGYEPAKTGTLIYLTVEGDLNDAIGRVTEAGGEVLMPKTPLGDAGGGGFVSWFVDSEGNRVGLYSAE